MFNSLAVPIRIVRSEQPFFYRDRNVKSYPLYVICLQNILRTLSVFKIFNRHLSIVNLKRQALLKNRRAGTDLLLQSSIVNRQFKTAGPLLDLYRDFAAHFGC